MTAYIRYRRGSDELNSPGRLGLASIGSDHTRCGFLSLKSIAALGTYDNGAVYVGVYDIRSMLDIVGYIAPIFELVGLR